MKPFMDKDFLLETETAKHLFHDYAENMPLAKASPPPTRSRMLKVKSRLSKVWP